MTELLSPMVLYAAFAASVLSELYFFMMQRSSLEISRIADINPRDGRFMLPLWYLCLWPIRLIKWGSALAIAITIHWGIAITLLVVAFLATIFVPIPHRHFIGLFRLKVRRELVHGENPELFQMLDDILDRAGAVLAAR